MKTISELYELHAPKLNPIEKVDNYVYLDSGYNFDGKQIKFSHQLYFEIYTNNNDEKLRDLIKLGTSLFNENRDYDSNYCKIRIISKNKVVVIQNEKEFSKYCEIYELIYHQSDNQIDLINFFFPDSKESRVITYCILSDGIDIGNSIEKD